MTALALIFATLAALLHAFIFYMESLAWEKKGPAVFGIAKEDIAPTKDIAYNLGFYNLFLGLITLAGVIAWTSSSAVGTALILAGTGSMFAAAAVLFLSSKQKRPAAIKQGTLPLLALIFVALA